MSNLCRFVNANSSVVVQKLAEGNVEDAPAESGPLLSPTTTYNPADYVEDAHTELSAT
jgi:hypothetical protein